MLFIAQAVITHVQKLVIFNLAPLHVLRPERVPHLPHPCYGFDHMLKKILCLLRSITFYNQGAITFLREHFSIVLIRFEI
jgi:hypothetical protein